MTQNINKLSKWISYIEALNTPRLFCWYWNFVLTHKSKSTLNPLIDLDLLSLYRRKLLLKCRLFRYLQRFTFILNVTPRHLIVVSTEPTLFFGSLFFTKLTACSITSARSSGNVCPIPSITINLHAI